jgi:2-dehydropantoate 2-reductase
MGQDMVKGRRTEIEFMNGLVVDKGKELGIATPANAVLTDIVKKVERGVLTPDKSHLTGLRESC